MRFRAVFLLAAFALLVTACGGSDEVTTTASPQSSTSTSTEPNDEAASVDADTPVTAEEVIEVAEEAIEGMSESLQEAQVTSGGGSATLTVGDQTWIFASVLCAVGEEETGQEGAELVVSSIQDGMQMYFDISADWGHSASLNDIEDFENPSVSLDSTGPYTTITLDGKNFSGTGEFVDGTSDSFDRVPGTFSGTCP